MSKIKDRMKCFHLLCVNSSFVFLLFMMPDISIAAEKTEAGKQAIRIHAVSHLGHQFSFYADGRFHRQYLSGQPVAMNWGSLYRYDFSDGPGLAETHLNPRGRAHLRELARMSAETINGPKLSP